MNRNFQVLGLLRSCLVSLIPTPFALTKPLTQIFHQILHTSLRSQILHTSLRMFLNIWRQISLPGDLNDAAL